VQHDREAVLVVAVVLAAVVVVCSCGGDDDVHGSFDVLRTSVSVGVLAVVLAVGGGVLDCTTS
jgi:hypothetical protein